MREPLLAVLPPPTLGVELVHLPSTLSVQIPPILQAVFSP